MPVDLDALVNELTFVNHKQTKSLEILEAIVDDAPKVVSTLDGASTLEVVVADADRKILRSPLINHRSWAVVGKGKTAVHFELVALSKSGDRFRLTFEDAIVAALRRRTRPFTVPAGSTTRREFALRLAREAGVPAIVDPTHTGKVASVLERSTHGKKTNSWEILGSDVAEPINWRRFSTGRALVLGGDDWLLDRDQQVTRVRENTGPYGTVDFDVDVAGRASEASVDVDASLWALPPGSAVLLEDLGPAASGKWLVSEFERVLTSSRGTVKLIRKQHVLDEPKRQGAGDPGHGDYVPGMDGSEGGGTAGTAAREKMVRWALAQKGKAYAWGGNGPDAFDCSGLVQEATRAAGRVLVKPSATQWDIIRKAGKACAVSTGIATRGALLFSIGGEFNHVAISLGNGSTIEALGTGYGVGVFKAAGRDWTSAGVWL